MELRLLWHDYRRQERVGLHQRLRRGQTRYQDLSVAAFARHQGLGARSDEFLCPIRLDKALAANPHTAAAGRRTAAVQGGPGEGGPALRLHSLRLLFHELPELLVE